MEKESNLKPRIIFHSAEVGLVGMFSFFIVILRIMSSQIFQISVLNSYWRVKTRPASANLVGENFAIFFDFNFSA